MVRVNVDTTSHSPLLTLSKPIKKSLNTISDWLY